jgi:hypothetical protein
MVLGYVSDGSLFERLHGKFNCGVTFICFDVYIMWYCESEKNLDNTHFRANLGTPFFYKICIFPCKNELISVGNFWEIRFPN